MARVAPPPLPRRVQVRCNAGSRPDMLAWAAANDIGVVRASPGECWPAAGRLPVWPSTMNPAAAIDGRLEAARGRRPSEDECPSTTVKNGAGRGFQPEPEPAHPADASGLSQENMLQPEPEAAGGATTDSPADAVGPTLAILPGPRRLDWPIVSFSNLD